MRKYFYQIRKYFYKYPILFRIFFVAFLSVLFIQFPLSNIEEKWQYGAEFGKVIYDLSIGYLISYLFFYIVVFRKEENDKRQINSRVSSAATLIILDGYEIFCMLIANNAKFNSGKCSFPPSFEFLKEVCLNTDPYRPNSQTNNTKDGHWFIPLKRKKRETLENISRIFQLLPYLDSELVGTLTKIEDSNYFYTLANLIYPQSQLSNNENFEFIAEPLFKYFESIKQLEIYCSKYLLDFNSRKQIIKDRIGFHSFAKDMVK